MILAWKSLLNRRGTALLTVLSIGLSVVLLVGVERLRTETRAPSLGRRASRPWLLR